MYNCLIPINTHNTKRKWCGGCIIAVFSLSCFEKVISLLKMLVVSHLQLILSGITSYNYQTVSALSYI